MRTHAVVISLFSLLLLAGCGDGNSGAIEGSGTIEGKDINIGTEVAGRIESITVDEGSAVQRGDTLVIIADEEYRLQLSQAAANAAAAEAQYQLARQGSRQEDIRQAEAAYRAAQADYTRMKDLLASKTITQKQFDDAEARYIAAQQTYQKLARGLREAEIETARARRDQAVAQAELLRKKVRDCRIIAPAAGTITLRAFEPGEFVPLAANILRITVMDTVELVIYVNEEHLGRLRLGQRAEISIDSFKDRTFEGRVVYISPAAEFTPKNVQTKEERTKLVFGVKIRVPNPGNLLKPGLPADAVIIPEEQANG